MARLPLLLALALVVSTELALPVADARPVAPPLLPRPAAVDNNSTPALLPTPTPKAPAISRSWVQPMGRDAHDWWRQMQKANADTVTALNRGGKRLDLVLYGDSITAFNMRPNFGKNQAGWRRIMAGLAAEPLGVYGSTVANLGWRLTQGGERLARDPTAIALLIGINNVYKRLEAPAPALESVVAWLRATHPTSRVLVLGLLPTTKAKAADVAAVNRQYAALAGRQGARYAACGQQLDPRDKKMMSDGLHLTSKGHDVLLACLRTAAGL